MMLLRVLELTVLAVALLVAAALTFLAAGFFAVVDLDAAMIATFQE